MIRDHGSFIDEATGNVYGHIVSVDSFGEAYVMPIHDTLLDIASHLGLGAQCVSVLEPYIRLPTADEIEEHVSAPGGVKMPANSSQPLDNERIEQEVIELASRFASITPSDTKPTSSTVSSNSVSGSRGHPTSWHTSSKCGNYVWMNDQYGRPQRYEVVVVQRWYCAWCAVPNGPWSVTLDARCPNCTRRRDAYSTYQSQQEYRRCTS